jgi:hypothetical protein
MINATLSVVERIIDILKIGGPYAFIVLEGVIIWKLWQRNEELHKRLERKK